MMDVIQRGSPVLTRTWALILGAAIAVISGGAACSKSPDPAGSRAGSGSAPAASGSAGAASGPASGPAGSDTPGAASGSAGAASGSAGAASGSAGAASGSAGSDTPAAPAGSAGSAGSADAGAPAAAGELRALSDDEVKTVVTPALRAGETVAHKPFRGPLGPTPDGVLVVVDRGGSAGGFVLVPQGKPERIELPPLSQGSLEGVPAVLFLDVDGKPGKEAIIMTRQMTGAGPQGAMPRAFNQVIAWNGSAFVRLSDVEEDLLDLETAAAIRKALAARAKKSR